MSDEKPRSFEVSIEIDAPPAEVWKAIAEADGIARWLAPEVKVTPGKGGAISVSWGPGMEGTQQIEVWEENRHLCLTEQRAKPYSCGGADTSGDAADAAETPLRIAVDYFLEAKDGGKTVLRLVHSGFGNSAGWDQEMESTRRGWPTFFRVMKHGIEFHPHEPASPVTLSIPSLHSAADAWERVCKALTPLNQSTRYELRSPQETLQGKLLIHGERHFAGVIENWNDALVSIVCEPSPSGPGSMLYFMLTLYGPAIAHAQAIDARWKEALTSLVN
ncbi:MAG: SRPBCC domain-containing protein [Bryobacterales bacterium]|nr:SRPBCC domain-containing protein [Bryobacterales bacterium]